MRAQFHKFDDFWARPRALIIILKKARGGAKAAGRVLTPRNDSTHRSLLGATAAPHHARPEAQRWPAPIAANEQIITIELGRDYEASKLLDELLDLSAEGLDYNVYKINSFEKKY